MLNVLEQSLPRSGKRKLHVFLVSAAVASVLAGCGQDPMSAGTAYLKKGDYASAVIEFKNAAQEKPDSHEVRLALAEALERANDGAGAERQLRKALELGGDPDSILPRIALMMLDRNELEKIIREFKDRSLKSPAANSSLKGIVATAYVAQKRLPLAEEHIKGATVTTPEVRVAQAQILLAGGKREAAYAVLEDALKDPNAPWWVLRALGRLSDTATRKGQSLEIIKRAYDAAPWHQGLTGEYAEGLVAAGKLDQAIPLRNKLKKEAPNYFWTHYLDAVVLSHEGRSEASHAAALKVLAVAPEHLPAALFASAAEIRRGDFLVADDRLRKMAKLYPYSLPTLQLLAVTQFNTGRIGESAETIRRGLSMAPADQQLLSLRADIELRKGSPREAAATLEALLAAHPNDALTLLRLSEIKTALGDRKTALGLLDKAAEAAMDDPLITHRIIASTLRTGNLAKASQLAEKTLKSHPKDPQSHLTLAATLAARKDSDGAWQATLAALDLKPAYTPALLALSASASTPKQKREVVVRYGKAVEAKAKEPQVYLNYAAMQQAEGKDADAVIRVLEKGAATVLDDSILLQALVVEHMRAGNADKALSIAQEGAAAVNAPASAPALLAATYERLGKTEQATDTYRKLVAAYPQRADWRMRLAEMEIRNNRKKEATTLLRSLISERPFDASAYIALANLTAPDNPAEAFSIARQLGERDEFKQTAMLLEGDILVLSGKTDEALKQFAKAAKGGALPAALLRSARLLDQLGRKQAADQDMAECLRKYPDDALVLATAAQREQRQGRHDKAVELFRKIVNKSPKDPTALNNLAWAQIQARNPEALENAIRAAAMMPGHSNVLDTLGVAQGMAGKHKEAVETLRTAVNLAPAWPTYRIHLAEQLLLTNDRKGAAAVLQPIDSKKLEKSEQEILNRLRQSSTG